MFLTLLGGGVFGNDLAWITAAIDHACQRVRPGAALDVRLVCYAGPGGAPAVDPRLWALETTEGGAGGEDGVESNVD